MTKHKKDYIKYEVKGPVSIITLNRPDYSNAQNGAMTYQLDDAFRKSMDDEAVKVIVLKGAGKHFCAGHDIGTPEGTWINLMTLNQCGMTILKKKVENFTMQGNKKYI